jgi:plastocyanin
MVDTTRRAVLAGGALSLGTILAGCSTAESARETTANPTGTDGRATADSGSATASGPQTAESGLSIRAEVAMESMPMIKFDPRVVHIAVGGTVVWRLDSGSHDTTAYHPDVKAPRRQDGPVATRIPEGTEPWGSEVLSHVGATFEWTFEEPGVYDYVDTEAVCTEHAMVGNMGRVIVGWPDPAGQPALEPPQEVLPELIRQKIQEVNPLTRELLENQTNTAVDPFPEL